MIALISGRVAVRRPDHVIVDCGGVGYRLAVSAETLRHVPAIGNEVSLHTHLVVRDDALALYGFASETERDLFLMLLGVQTVGPKMAIAVLSGAPPRELLAAVAAGDVSRLRAPGVGKRTAERIIVELREKVAATVAEDEISVTRGRRPALGWPVRRWPASATARRDRVAAGRRRGRLGRAADLPCAAERPPMSTAPPRLQDPAPVPGDDPDDDRSLRPRRLQDFVGQETIREQLAVSITAALERGEALDHVLLAGPPGLGKTSLAQIIAAELDAPFTQTAGPALERKGDIASYLAALEPGAVFVRRRDPPAAAGAGGDVLSGDGGSGSCRSPSVRARARGS